jgi:hypothetical protein
LSGLENEKEELSNKKRSKIYINVGFGTSNVKCLLDTGAEISVIGEKGKKFWEQFADSPNFKTVNLRTAGGELHTGQGVKKLPINYDNDTKKIQFVYAPSIKIPVTLGMNFFNAWGMEIRRKKVVELNAINLGEDVEMEDTELVICQSEVNEEEWELNEEQKKKFTEAMASFNFSEGDTIGCQHLLEHKIDTGDNTPIFSFPYRYNPLVTDKIKEIIQRWLELKIIEKSHSDWRLPIVVVKKSNGTLRLCLDARKLNAITRRDCHTPPNVLHKLDNLPHMARYFVRLDLNEAFLQTKLAYEDKKKTAFSIPGIGEFQFIRMPFGLINSPATQSRLMEQIFGDELSPYVMHYLDDVIIMGTCFEQLIENLKKVATLLTANNLTVSKKKTSNVLKRIRILGHIIDREGIHTDPEKIKTIQNWARPKTGKELQQFLGFANWYRRFIKDYATIAGPLYEISKKRNLDDSLWSEERERSFEEIKVRMCKSPVLRPPDWSRPMIIQADACDKGIGAILAQRDEQGHEYVIEYYSYKLTEAERKYSPTELEMLAVLKAVRHFRYYIEYNELTIFSDHHALQYLLSMKLLSSKHARWILELQPYVNKIVHRAGKLMVAADAISRASFLPMELVEERPDGWYEEFLSELKNNPDNYSQYHVEGDKIFRKIPWKRNELQDDYREMPRPHKWQSLVEKAHEKVEHGGIKAVNYELSHKYWWPTMRIDIKTIVKCCKKCAAIKSPNYATTAPMGGFRVPKDTFESLSVDIKGPLPIALAQKYRYILVVSDLLSRYAWAQRLTAVNSQKILKFLKIVSAEVGKNPKEIYHDNAKYFMSDDFQSYLKKHDIKSRPTAIYHPQGNPVERINRSIAEGIRLEIIEDPTKQHRWASSLKNIMDKINNRICTTTQYTPYEVFYGRKPHESTSARLVAERHDRIKKQAHTRSILRYLQNKKQFDRRALHREFEIGEIVMIQSFHLSSSDKNENGKLWPPWEVAKVQNQDENYSYSVLKLSGKTVKLNIKHIKGISNDLQKMLIHLFPN